MIPLVVSVDTEEEGLWNGLYRIHGNTTENLRGLSRFQALCDRFGIVPTYLITAPVLDNAAATRELAAWQQAGKCEIGAHCHPWCNPPLTSGDISSQESFLSNLSEDEQYAKLEWLTERIADRIGQRPTSFRAGRYGFSLTTAECLARLGYEVDSSVLPLFEFRGDCGPDFVCSPESPHWLELSERSRLLEIPVTSGFTRPGFRWRRTLWRSVRRSPWKQARLPGILDRMAIASRVKLSPEGYAPRQLRQLIDARLCEQAEVLVLMLHSSSLVAGMSPYAPDNQRLEQLYRCLETTFRHAVQQRDVVPTPLTGAARELELALSAPQDSHLSLKRGETRKTFASSLLSPRFGERGRG